MRLFVAVVYCDYELIKWSCDLYFYGLTVSASQSTRQVQVRWEFPWPYSAYGWVPSNREWIIVFLISIHIVIGWFMSYGQIFLYTYSARMQNILTEISKSLFYKGIIFLFCTWCEMLHCFLSVCVLLSVWVWSWCSAIPACLIYDLPTLLWGFWVSMGLLQC